MPGKLLFELRNILDEMPRFILGIEKECRQLGVVTNNLPLDHVCFRTSTSEIYAALCDLFCGENQLLAESTVGGRLISVFKLRAPVVCGDRTIEVIEVPAPKMGSPYPDGWEHAEFVISESLSAFAEKFSNLTFDRSGSHKAYNPDIALKLPSGRAVKFHQQTLAEVILHEKAL